MCAHSKTKEAVDMLEDRDMKLCILEVHRCQKISWINVNKDWPSRFHTDFLNLKEFVEKL